MNGNQNNDKDGDDNSRNQVNRLLLLSVITRIVVVLFGIYLQYYA